MTKSTLFSSMSSARLATLIQSATRSVCYAAPGLQMEVANALVQASHRIGPELVTVCLDFDERVMRMGYGDIRAVEAIRAAEISARSTPGLRTGLLVVDDAGWIFTPTALYLEADPIDIEAPNAVQMSKDQIAEALARLSPSAKAIAIAQAMSPEEKKRIAETALDVHSEQVTNTEFEKVSSSLKSAPPVNFDLARQVRVFEPYLQYVELSLSGAAIQRHRLAIPKCIQKLGGSEDIEMRLQTTYELIERGSALSSKPLEKLLNEIRKNFTPSLGKDHGRVVLKSAKERLLERLKTFRDKLQRYQSELASQLQTHLDQSREQVISYYLPRVIQTPPDALVGTLLTAVPTEQEARRWLERELSRVFPRAEALIHEMKLEERYKDVTFETLNRSDFLELVKNAFPTIDWDKTYKEFRAVGEREKKQEQSTPKA